MNKKIIIVMMAVLLAVSIAVLGGCAPQQADPAAPGAVPEGAPAEALTGRLVVGGSTSVAVVADYLAERFMAAYPGIVVEVHHTGSGAGITGANEGAVDIGMSSRWLEAEERGFGLSEFVICHDALAPIVHPDNPVTDLTLEQLRKIFLGEIANWTEVGGNDLPITVVVREAGSGTRDAWEGIIHEDIEPYEELVGMGTGGVKAMVAGDPSAISYVTVAALDETVRALKVGGVEPTAETVLAEEYAITRPFLFVTKGDPSPLAQQFIDYVLGPEGQQLLADEGMVRIR
jgi:phosphate transport system substrate-binding protein